MNPVNFSIRGARNSRRHRWPVLALSLLALSLVVFAGCGDFFISGNAIASIALSPNNPTIQPAATQQFTATATLGDGTTSDVTSQATWSSSSTNVATINNSGLATAAATGTTTITAASGGVTGTTTLTVSTQTVSSITIAPANPTLFTGQVQQMKATATLSDGTTRDVTTTVTWTSSNANVVSVTNTGLVTAITSGTATITATAGTVTVSTNVTVT
jgi:uncharacterized protein YjdB